MRVRKQGLRLVLLMISCQLVISCGRPPALITCRGPVYINIGRFDSVETGARAAVRRLSQEIHRCGEVEEYNIAWRFPGSEQERGWRTLKYMRKDKTSGRIGYEYQPASGPQEPTFIVDDTAVDKVANEAGLLDDFEKYKKKKE